MVELGAIYRLCVSVCLSVCRPTALLKKVVSPSDCKIFLNELSCTVLLKKVVSPSDCKITK